VLVSPIFVVHSHDLPSLFQGNTSQRWDLDPVRFQHQPTFQEGMSYLIKNHATGRVIWLTNNRLTCFGHDDGDSALTVSVVSFLEISLYSHILCSSRLKTSRTGELPFVPYATSCGSHPNLARPQRSTAIALFLQRLAENSTSMSPHSSLYISSNLG
jgi:hypothetical protein